MAFLSNLIIPVLFFSVIGYALVKKVNVFDAFVFGVNDGIKIVFKVLPTLIGLMIAIGILRDSGVMDWLAGVFGPVAKLLHFPKSLVPLSIVKMISSSAATGLLLDVYKTAGPDSYSGYLASLLMCCSETIFYTVSVYFMATGDKEHAPVTKSRWTLPGALLATFAGTVASVIVAGMTNP